MTRPSSSGSREGKVILALAEALNSSLDIRAVLERAYPRLLELVPADYGALGISSSGRPEDYAWTVAELPPAFFAAYPEMAPHDFVRCAVAGRLNVVLRDEEMVPRAELEANMMYRRAREVGAPLEQVIAVMLHVDARWQSGLSIFRDRRRPFSVRERDALQRVTPMLANAVRNCHRFGERAALCAALQAGRAMIQAAPPATEIDRTPEATAILDRWFAPHERREGRLPDPLATFLTRAAATAPAPTAPWETRRDGASLRVSCAPLPGVAPSYLLLLEERRPDEPLPPAPLPPSFRDRLTKREQEMTLAVLAGADNQQIAADLGVALGTVKTHLFNVYNKLGVGSRAALLARAADLYRRENRAGP